MWHEESHQQDDLGDDVDHDFDTPPGSELDPSHCHDRGKARATVQQYVALIGDEVAGNLEGIARARLEDPRCEYQTDAAVHQAYMQIATGGGECGDNDEPAEAAADGAAPAEVSLRHFETIPWNIHSEEEMQTILDFGHRVRLTSFTQELLKLPCMQIDRASTSMAEGDRAALEQLKSNYRGLATASQEEHFELAEKQAERLQISRDEEDMEIDDAHQL